MLDARSNLLKRLDAFVGEWRTYVSIKGHRASSGGWATHAPTRADWLTGLDDSASTFTRLYADSRGVCRVYQMTLELPVSEYVNSGKHPFERCRRTHAHHLRSSEARRSPAYLSAG